MVDSEQITSLSFHFPVSMMSQQVSSADRIDSNAQSTAGQGGGFFWGVACILQEGSCFTSIKAIYVSHCALEVVQRQSSLICFSSLTHRLDLRLWWHPYKVPCMPKKLRKEAGQMTDDLDQVLAVINSDGPFIAAFPHSLLWLYLLMSDTCDTRQKLIGRSPCILYLQYWESSLAQLTALTLLISTIKHHVKHIDCLLVPLWWNSVMQ